MKSHRTALFSTLLLLVAIGLPTASTGQLPLPATPRDMLTGESPVAHTPPVAALVESILAGDDDPATWAQLEEALGERASEPALALDGGPRNSSTGSAGAASWMVAPTWATDVFANPASPEALAVLGVLGLLLVAAAGAAVGALRRRRRPRPGTVGRVGTVRSRRRRGRGSAATCRDAARLEARLRHRRAA